jgi:hypothetical protein
VRRVRTGGTHGIGGRAWQKRREQQREVHKATRGAHGNRGAHIELGGDVRMAKGHVRARP